MSAEPLNISEVMTAAVGHHRAGQLQAAEALYRQVLAVEPNHAAAWHLLGVVHWQRGQLRPAAEAIGRAIRLNGALAAFHANLGHVYGALQQPDAAEACYRRALELNPDLAEVHVSLGNVLLGEGRADEAERSYRAALALHPEEVGAWCNLSGALQSQGRLDEAVECCDRALRLAPDFAEAHASLGGARFLQVRLDEAAVCLRRALEIEPQLHQAHNNLGRVLQEQGRLDDAAECFARAGELKPDWADPHANLGVVFHDQGRIEEAIGSYRRALALRPERSDVYCNLGTALQDQEKLDEAIACYRRALELRPRLALAWLNLGKALREQGQLIEAIACYRQATLSQEDFLAALGALVHEMSHVCQWDGIEELARRICELVDRDPVPSADEPLSPFALLTLPIATMPRQQLRCARRWAESRLNVQDTAVRDRRPHRGGPIPSKITVGYLSADFNNHAIAVLAAELFEKHDRERFSVIGYSHGRDDASPMRARLIAGFDRFVDIRGLSHRDAARRMVDDGVDILVDLTGYTKNSRSQILALRPAPLQINFLGYVGTMGTPLVDYIVVDEFVVPPELQPYYIEQLVHLGGCYMVNDSRRAIGEHTPSRGECGLPAEGFVFCSFNNNYKITPAVFAVWMRLLAAVPGSVLWLLEGNRHAPDNLRREAAARGIAPDRLVFAPHAAAADHLARHRLADLFLDTFPYNAHTTASDALWAGCPLLTLAGETFPSRVAGSLLLALGLSELITWRLEDYETTALRLATNRAELAGIRARLAEQRLSSGVFDAVPFARMLEGAYATMWERHLAGQPPAAFRARAV
jgi:protein O-GlcNAc transferase